MSVRIEKRSGRHVVSVDVPDDAEPVEVALALRSLERAADVVERLCPGCYAPLGVWHSPECMHAPADLIERARAEAGLA